MSEENNQDEEGIVDWYVNDFEPDDDDEIEKQKAAEFRKSDKAGVIRELIRKGHNPAQIKLYGPRLLAVRERDAIRKIEEGAKPKRRVLGKPIKTGSARR